MELIRGRCPSASHWPRRLGAIQIAGNRHSRVNFQPQRVDFHPVNRHTSKVQTIGVGWSSPVARQAHNLKVAGSNPAPATNSMELILSLEIERQPA